MSLLAILAVVGMATAGCTTEAKLSAERSASLPVVATPTVEQRRPSLPSMSPVPSIASDIRWQHVGTIAPESTDDEHGTIAVVGFEAGYVLLNSGSQYLVDETPTIRFSTDGTDWTSVRLPLDEGTVLQPLSFATDGTRVMAVGSYTPCDRHAFDQNPFGACRGRPVSWVSDDGRTWRNSETWTGTVGRAGQGGSAFGSAWAVPTGGWDAAQVFNTGDESDDGVWLGPALWHSNEGVTWSLLRARPGERSSACSSEQPEVVFWAVTDVDGRRVASCATEDSTGFSTTVMVSSDGRRYARVDASQAQGAWVSEELGPNGSGPWLLAGGTPVSSRYSEAVGWASGDLTVWTTIVLPVPTATVTSRALALGHGAAGYVATGEADAGDDGAIRAPITWLSDDGRTWRIVDTKTRIDDLADGPAGLLGFGRGPAADGSGVGIWRLGMLR